MIKLRKPGKFIHPIVDHFVGCDYVNSWADLRDLLLDTRITKMHLAGDLSYSLVQRYAVGKHAAHWFIPALTELLIREWIQARSKQTSPEKAVATDAYYAGMISDDVVSAYNLSFLLSKDYGTECNIDQLRREASRLTSFVIRQTESSLEVKLPELYHA